MSLETHAAALAAGHHPLRRPRTSAIPLLALDSTSASIARATRGFRTPRPGDAQFQKSGEWFLDNHYLVSRTLRQIATEIPEGFRRRLPFVAGDSLPRILRVARALVEATEMDFDEATLVAYVQAYQTVSSLTIAELWALPAMLRIATLAPLVRTLDAFFVPPPAKRAEPAEGATTWETRLEPGVRVERAVRALRLLGEVDWRPFIQTTSAVEATLREDPSGIYDRMEFEARDAYRKAVESLAWDTERAEPEVARVAVTLATEGMARCTAGDPREGHVGYYLVDGGLRQLKERISYRARGLERLREALRASPTWGYLGSIAALSLVFLAVTVAALSRACGSLWTVLTALLSIVPLVSVAVALTNRWVVRLFPRASCRSSTSRWGSRPSSGRSW